jgi:hypothetical protein
VGGGVRSISRAGFAHRHRVALIAGQVQQRTNNMTISEKDNQRLQELAKLYPRAFRGVVIPWYTSESWPKMLDAAADRSRLHDTFEEFERSSAAKFNDLVAKGQPVEKIQLDVAALIAWCRAEGRPLDGMARHIFALLSVIERDKTAGHA